MSLRSFLNSFKPHAPLTPLAEKFHSGMAGGLAILLLGIALYYLPQHRYPLIMMGSMAASAVLLFAAPHSPFSQPWNLVGGHLVSALAGWVCILLIPDPVIASGAAVGTAIFLMHIMNCLHPPGAATALTLVLASGQFHDMGWQWVAMIVIANVLISLLLALLINNVLPGRRYPMQNSASIHPKTEPPVMPEQADIEWALTRMDSVIDVSIEDLTAIYEMAQERARYRFNSNTNNPDSCSSR